MVLSFYEFILTTLCFSSSFHYIIKYITSKLISHTQTKITLETFLAWKKRKLKEKEEQAIKDEEKKRNDYKAGRQIGISGREMFYFNPDLAMGDGKFIRRLQDANARVGLSLKTHLYIVVGIDDGDEAISSYARDEEDDSEDVQYRELDMERLASEASEIDTKGITVASVDRLKAQNVTDTDVTGNKDFTKYTFEKLKS